MSEGAHFETQTRKVQLRLILLVPLLMTAELAAAAAAANMFFPAERAAKCWDQYDESATDTVAAMLLTLAAALLWLGARRVAGTHPYLVLRTTWFTIITLIGLAVVMLLPVGLISFPLIPRDAAETEACTFNGLSALLVGSNSYAPLATLIILAVMLRSPERVRAPHALKVVSMVIGLWLLALLTIRPFP